MQLGALTFAADSIYLRVGLHKRFEGREGGGTRDLACLSGDAVQGMLEQEARHRTGLAHTIKWRVSDSRMMPALRDQASGPLRASGKLDSWARCRWVRGLVWCGVGVWVWVVLDFLKYFAKR